MQKRARAAAAVVLILAGLLAYLLAPGAMAADTRLVIANAVYFKGQWASRFPRKNTRAEAFWVSPDRAVQVPMLISSSRSSRWAPDSC